MDDVLIRGSFQSVLTRHLEENGSDLLSSGSPPEPEPVHFLLSEEQLLLGSGQNLSWTGPGRGSDRAAAPVCCLNETQFLLQPEGGGVAVTCMCGSGTASRSRGSG